MLDKIRNSFKGDNYQARALRSTGMVLLNFGSENILRLISNLILTRLLFPEAFGLMALVQVVIAGVAMFSDLGFRSAIIQHPRGNDPVFLNTAWTLQILRGLLLMAIIMACAGPAAAFYEEPMLEGLLMIAAFVPLFRGFESVNMLTANRTLQLERLTLLMIGCQFVGIVVTISLAWALGSVWALAMGLLVQPLLQAVLSHLVLEGHRNKLHLEREATWMLLTYGGFIFIASAASFFAVHGDRAVLGKYVSLEALAIYNIALLLAQVPRRLSIKVAERILLALYARRPPSESARNRRKINQARGLVTGSLFVMTLGLALVGDWLIRLLYDVRYEAAGPYLVMIAIAALPQVIIQSYMQVPLASGHSGRYAILQILTALARFGTLVLLVPPFGLVGAVIAMPLATFLLYPALLWINRPYAALDPRHDILAFLGWALISALVIWWHADIIHPILDAAGLTYTR
ncbi:MAG: oligosaccharide flippase family protein [Rhodobacter sp.]|nr:oligosaccharide flippase family protein [Rhodobacter sp.]